MFFATQLRRFCCSKGRFDSLLICQDSAALSPSCNGSSGGRSHISACDEDGAPLLMPCVKLKKRLHSSTSRLMETVYWCCACIAGRGAQGCLETMNDQMQGMDSADRGHSRFAFHDAINTMNNSPVTGADIALADRGQKCGNPL